jgi:hypothetical protein
MFRRWLQRMGEAQEALPLLLRFHMLVPGTIVLVGALGLLFSIPPTRQLEGLAFFMEGGCDWGLRNQFFYAKVGLLVVAHVAFALCLVWPPRVLLGFLPHLVLLLAMGWLQRSGSWCEEYLGYSNGSVGQMCLELAGFSALGVALLPHLQGRPAWMSVLAVGLWNAVHVGLFFLGLEWTPHWTWAHTGLVAGGQAVLASGVWLLGRPRRTSSQGFSVGGQFALCGLAGLLLVGLLEAKPDGRVLFPLLAVLFLWAALELLRRWGPFSSWVPLRAAVGIVALGWLGLQVLAYWEHERSASQVARLHEQLHPLFTPENVTRLRREARLQEAGATSWLDSLLGPEPLPSGSTVRLFAPVEHGSFLYVQRDGCDSYADERMLRGPGSARVIGDNLIQRILDSRQRIASTAWSVHDEALWGMGSTVDAFIGWPVLDERGEVLAVVIIEED